MAKKGKKKGRVVSIDFTGVKSGGGGGDKIPEGEYLVTVKEVNEEVSEKSGKPYLNWVLEIAEGKYAGKRLYHITSLQPQALFNLRNTLEAAGVEVPEKLVDVNLDDLIDRVLGVSVEHEEYQGKKKSKVVDTFAPEDMEGDDDDDEEEDEDDEDEDDEEEEDEDEENYDEMDLADLKKLCKERGLKVPKKAKKNQLVEMLEDDDEEDE